LLELDSVGVGLFLFTNSHVPVVAMHAVSVFFADRMASRGSVVYLLTPPFCDIALFRFFLDRRSCSFSFLRNYII